MNLRFSGLERQIARAEAGLIECPILPRRRVLSRWGSCTGIMAKSVRGVPHGLDISQGGAGRVIVQDFHPVSRLQDVGSAVRVQPLPLGDSRYVDLAEGRRTDDLTL